MFANASMKWNSNNTTMMWIYEVCCLLGITWKCCCKSNLSKWTVMKSWQFIAWLHSWMINVPTEFSSQNCWFKILKCIRVMERILLLRFFFFTSRLDNWSEMIVYQHVSKGNICIKLCTTSDWKNNVHKIMHISTFTLKITSTVWCDKCPCSFILFWDLVFSPEAVQLGCFIMLIQYSL